MTTYDEHWQEPYEEHPDDTNDRWQEKEDDEQREQDERDRIKERGE